MPAGRAFASASPRLRVSACNLFSQPDRRATEWPFHTSRPAALSVFTMSKSPAKRGPPHLEQNMNSMGRFVKPPRPKKARKTAKNGPKCGCRNRAFSTPCDPKMRNVGVHPRPSRKSHYDGARERAMADEIHTLTWQFELAWKLAQHHLPKLTDEACLWEPAPGSWTVRKSVDGQWRPDWSDAEPDPAPPVTIAWLTWQMIWWWSSALTATFTHPLPARESI